ncbi:hypothetical protein ACJMK2_034103 [Sinanodonta woodiana]|uniref:CCHC-type domain-containing protein n=2 Tax=Sinanodonta woodiana TaxID=1069815 RepID=A0ABD3UU85_SINWO
MSESPDPEIQFCLNRNEEGHGDVIDDDQYAYDEHGSNQIHSDGEETIYTGQNQNHSHHPRREANNTSTIPIRSFPNFGPTLKPEPFNGSNDNSRIGVMLQRIEKRIELLEKGNTPLNNVKDWKNQIQTKSAPRNEKRRTCFVCNSPGHFFRNCPTFIQCKTRTSNGDEDEKNEAPSQGNKRPSSTYNQGNDRPLIQ